MAHLARPAYGAFVATPLTHTRRFTHTRPGRRLPLVLLALLTAIWLVLAIDPVSRQDWFLENILVLVSVPVLVATRHRMRFSNGAYVCLFIFYVLHSIGAHYTYSLVP